MLIKVRKSFLNSAEIIYNLFAIKIGTGAYLWVGGIYAERNQSEKPNR